MADEAVQPVDNQLLTVPAEPVPASDTPAPEPTEPVVAPEPVATDDTTSPEPTDDKGSEPKKIVKDLINLRKRAQTAEERIRELEIENRVYKGMGAPAPTQTPATPEIVSGPPIPPDPEQFEGGRYSDEYEAEMENYRVAKTEYNISQKQEREKQAEQLRVQQEAAKTVEAKFQERLEAAAETDPDILTITTEKWPCSYAMGQAIKESDASPKLLRYLFDHQDEAKTIYDLAPSWLDQNGRLVQGGNPLAAARAIGRLEAKLTMAAPAAPKPAPTKIVTAAPEPVTTVSDRGGTPVVAQLDDSTDAKEWIRERNRREFAARKRS